MTETVADKEKLARKAARRERHAVERATKRRRAATALRVFRASVRWMPMSMACALGHALGTLGYFIAGRMRRQSLEHLAFAMPELSPGERRRIARRSCALIGRSGMAFLVGHRMGREKAMKLVRHEGEQNVRGAMAEGKGVLFVTFHYGCFEMLASLMGGEFGTKALARPTDFDGPTALLIEMRREMGCDTIGRGEPIEVIRALRSGMPIAMLIDQDTSDVQGGFVPFFGRLAHTPLGPAALSVRTGAPVVIGLIAWEGLTHHKAYALPPLYPRTDLDRDAATLELTARITKTGEDEIRKRPEHWVWMHRRWETRPEDHPEYPVFDSGTGLKG